MVASPHSRYIYAIYLLLDRLKEAVYLTKLPWFPDNDIAESVVHVGLTYTRMLASFCVEIS